MRYLFAALAVALACALPAAAAPDNPRAVVRAHLAALHKAHNDGVRYWTLVQIAQQLALPVNDPRVAKPLAAVRGTLLADYQRACGLVRLTVPTKTCVNAWYAGQVWVEKYTVGAASVDHGEAHVGATLDGQPGVFVLEPTSAGWRITSWQPSEKASASGPAA